MSSIGTIEDEDWLANHLSFDKDSPFSNPLNPLPPALKRIEGIDKLRRSLSKELSNSSCIRDKSSNLPHLLSIVKCIWPSSSGQKDQCGDGTSPTHNDILSKCPAAVLKPFSFSEGKIGRLIVDIVSNDGSSWYKISARNPKSLALVAAGGGGYGRKSIVEHALDYLKCAEENPNVFRPPKVCLVFTSGIGQLLCEELEHLGVEVIGRRIEDEELGDHPRIKVLHEGDLQPGESPQEESKLDEEPFTNPTLEGVQRLNLDISTLLAYLSNLTNGHENVCFKKKILADQAEAERKRPQKPILDKIFEGRELFCCETTAREFQQILGTVGGPEEQKRAEIFFQEKITIVPDQVTEKGKMLTVSGNIKERSVVIFSTGDAIQAVTVTSNSGFVRSARSQGVDFPSFIHESRALTEQKEMSPEHIL